jgi:hypothetical protein
MSRKLGAERCELFGSKLALPGNSLMRFGGALNPIFELTFAVGQCLVTT